MRWSAFVLLAGCAAGDDDAPELVVENMAVLDVIIAPSGLTIYARSESYDESCKPRFPSIGNSVRIEETVWSCEPSLFGCIERISYAGSTYETPTTNQPLAITSPPSGPTLVLEGCGVRSIVVLPTVALPAPPTMVRGAISHDAQNRVIDVGWDGDPRATTHLVTLGSSLWSEVHHVANVSDQFTTPYLGNLVTSVQSLLPGSQRIAQHGLVRFWPASDATSSTLQAVL